MSKKREEATVEIPSKDPPKKDDDKKEKENKSISGIDEPKDPKTKKDNKKDKKEERELSAEDEALKNRLDEMVAGILDTDYQNVAQNALNLLKTEIRSATASMTSVPKPLKFLKNHYENIKAFYDKTIKLNKSTDPKSPYVAYSDLMSLLAMTMEDPQTRLCLKYRLEADLSTMSEWGTQYLKHLAAEIRIEMETRLAAEDDPEKTADLVKEEDIQKAVHVIVEYYMDNSAEADAIDLLLEVERKELIKKYCGEHNHERVCSYLRSTASFLPPPDDIEIYQICFDLYLQFKNYYHAVRFALKLDNKKLVRQVMRSLKDRPLMKRQCAYLLGWHQYMGYDEDEEDELSDDEATNYPILESSLKDIEDYETEFNKILNGEDDDTDNKNEDDDEDEDLPDVNDIVGNHQLSEAFHTLARDLDVLDPKDPESDIFKEQLVGASDSSTQSSTEVISARKSLAITYVNGFVNAGYGRDKFMMSGGSDNTDSTSINTANDWIAKNKERGQLAAVASIGTIMLWDEEAANCVDRYFESNQAHIRAGAYLAIGISCSGMKSESGMGLALLSAPALNDEGNRTKIERLCSILGLGLSYAGQGDAAEEVYDTLGQMISTEESDDISSLSALCLGYTYVGTCNAEICNIILADLMEREPDTLNNPLFLLNVLGLGLLFLGKQEEVDVTLEAMEVFDELNPKFSKTCKVCLECLAYAGTGNVLKIQKMLGILGEHFDDEFDEEKKKKAEEEKKEEKKQAADDDDDDDDKKNKEEDYRYFQSIATLGISIIALGEDLGTTMSLRMFNHLIQYGNIRVKRAVPLALAMISVSNPLLEISDVLSKLSHDHDDYVSRNAIFALGLIGAGTNNARIARMLRSLTNYYQKDADHLYMIRIAQGLIHLGKGLLTVKCFHSDRFLLNKVSICGILTTLFCNIGTSYNPKQNPLDKEKYIPPWSGNTISLLSDFHYLLYTLNLCIKPRMLITLDNKKLKPLITTVRVGQAVDTVGAAGKNPKRITGFQTHETPILLQYNDRAELASDKYISIASVLEGFAVLRLNPDSDVERRKRRRAEKEAAKKAKEQENKDDK